ncbi:MAG: S8 family serine peptidase, partial [Hymenobacteraceae bacterium]|nr:S8 family serine peptidase [Hymenobacteraceae bacterium]MDX5510893.1 S8 family serine peptidase [Hymenobacteraceae bacterium]
PTDQVNLSCLHDRGYQGRGSLIAVFDTGFPGVNLTAPFDSLRQQNRIVATGNFVSGGSAVYHSYEHGTNVLSIIAANQAGTYVGAAAQASFALAITENMASETHQEELNWAAAAEWADSLGADIIQSSLSYRYFDAGQGDYTDADLDGNTAIITVAADKAASKGILVVNSAGNDGMFTFPLSPLISPPSDGDSVLTVGAVNGAGQYSPISSIGPTADGRVKPDVVARGANTPFITSGGSVGYTSGTSLSTPIVSGLAACLMQANPGATNMQVYQAIIRSASRYSNPNNQYGFGLPDACKADSLLKIITGTKASLKQPEEVRIYPTSTASVVQVSSSADNTIATVWVY